MSSCLIPAEYLAGERKIARSTKQTDQDARKSIKARDSVSAS